MTDEKPHYFIEFEKGLECAFSKIDKRFEQIDEKFDRIDTRFEKIERKLDTNTEALGELMIKVTGIEDMLHKNRRDTLNLSSRTGRLEKEVFGERVAV